MWVNQVSAILSGFSIVSAAILMFAYLFFLPDMRKTVTSKLACVVMLAGIALLQLAHFSYFSLDQAPLESRQYCVLLALLPAAFFFFSREILFPGFSYRWIDLVHLLPIIFSLFAPIEVIPGVAFFIGTLYTLWFAKIIFRFRDQRGRFKFEIFFFGMFALMAVIALILGLLLPVINAGLYYLAYANSISLAMTLVVAALLVFPELLSDILLMAELAYAKTKLGNINVEQKVLELENLMVRERHFENESLSLAMMADTLELSSHQLSELINTEYGYGFPRFVREHRLRAAKSLLVSEPGASVLSISMMTGFKSQSSFYTAFKEATGESPAQYRKKRLSNPS